MLLLLLLLLLSSGCTCGESLWSEVCESHGWSFVGKRDASGGEMVTVCLGGKSLSEELRGP